MRVVALNIPKRGREHALGLGHVGVQECCSFELLGRREAVDINDGEVLFDGVFHMRITYTVSPALEDYCSA